MTSRPANLILNSLKGRLILASMLILPIICALLAWTLERAYSSSLLKSQERQMTAQVYALIAEAELEEHTLWLPELMTNDSLNQISSGISAAVYSEHQERAIWESISKRSDGLIRPTEFKQISPGQAYFKVPDTSQTSFFTLYLKVIWEDTKAVERAFVFAVYESQTPYINQLSNYQRTLWLWLTVISLILIFAQVLILLWGLKPLDRVIEDLSDVQKGKAKTLSGNYPTELNGMTTSINKLIQHEIKQRERYRNTLADLAHSIKNPVAIISSALHQLRNTSSNGTPLDDIEEQNQRINQIISYQLTRAVGQSAAPFHTAIDIRLPCEKIASAMKKVYAEKSIDISLDIAPETYFRGDQGDLMELLGNLIDNACKYGRERVRIWASHENQMLTLNVEDDGQGISPERLETILKRGERIDTTIPGQGIGLAVVEDIVQNYSGEISLTSSPLGGLKAIVQFKQDKA